MWCYLFGTFICTSSSKVKLSFPFFRYGLSPAAKGNVPLPHMGKSISTSQLKKKENKASPLRASHSSEDQGSCPRRVLCCGSMHRRSSREKDLGSLR